MKKFYLLTKTLLVATVLLMGGATSAWAQDPELVAVTTEKTWDFATMSYTSGSAEAQFLDDNTLYIGAGITKNARAVFNAVNSDYPNALGSNIIAFKAGIDGQVFIQVSSYNGNVKITDGINEIKSYSRDDHDGGVSYLRHYFNVTEGTTYYIYASSVGSNTGVLLLHFFPCANTTEPLSMTEESTWDFTPTSNRVTIDFNGITWDNLYQGAGVKHYVGNNSKKVDVTRLGFSGKCDTDPTSETTAQTICFKIPAYSKGRLTYKLSTTAANIKVKCGNTITTYNKGNTYHNTVQSINVDNSASSTAMNVWFYSTECTSFDKDNITGLYYITWTPSAHTYTINAVDGNSSLLQELSSAKCMEGRDYSKMGLPKVVAKDGKYYVLNDGTVTNFATQDYTMGTEDETKSITYTEDGSIVYFSELEDLSSTSEKTGDYSGGKGSAIKSGGISSITTLPAGKYVATGAFCNDEKNRGMYLRTSNTNSSENVIVYTGGTYWTGEHSTDEFTLNASTAIYVTGFTATSGSSVNQSATLDYIIIRRSSVSATISAYGWATFSSDYPLDFTSVSDLEACMITGHEGNAVTKSQVTGTVPAGTGLLLKGAAGSYTIPVVASSSTDVSANKLVAGTGAAVSYEEGDTKYVLGVSASSEAEFQKIVEGTPATVAKGKAYLLFEGESLARTMSFEGDKVTGISEAKSEVDFAKEGKFVEGGKLVIFKKGMKFNANGQIVK